VREFWVEVVAEKYLKDASFRPKNDKNGFGWHP